jgi:hypothetical protein
LVARLIGRNLTPLQGCVVQVAAVLAFGFFAWWLFASGTVVKFIEPISRWYAEQALPHIASPSTLP